MCKKLKRKWEASRQLQSELAAQQLKALLILRSEIEEGGTEYWPSLTQFQYNKNKYSLGELDIRIAILRGRIK